MEMARKIGDGKREKIVYLLDGTSLAYKAFYAIKKDLSTSQGFPTNAIYGFIRMFLKLYKELKPKYLAIAFDVKKKTFRSKIFKDYKANRKKAPDNFKVQLPYIKKFLECFGAKVLEKEGFEADDVLGTVAKKLSKEGIKVVIITPDKDIRQLIDENISVLSVNPQTKEKKLYDLETFKKEYEMEPSQLPDLFGLSGDSIDNIPGVPGIGEKTAKKFILEFKTLENLYENLDKLTKKKKELLEKYKDQAFLSKTLAKIDTDVPINVSLQDLELQIPNGECLGEILKELEMKSIQSELKKLFPDIELGKEKLEKSKEIPKEKLREKIFPKDLFSSSEVAVIYDDELIVATSDGYSLLAKDEILEFLPRRGVIYTFDLKKLYHEFGEKIKDFPFVDLSLCEYLINPLKKGYSAKEILEERLEITDMENVKDYSHYTVTIGRKILKELKEKGLEELYKKIEHPLAFVLYKMEERGVLFDKDYLLKFGKELSQEAKKIEEKIFLLAGERFNLNSTKELSRILFEKLGLKPFKKTKTRYSVDAETLEKLALQGEEIAKLILEHRKLSKLNSTFVKGIIRFVDEDGRVHTKFLQTSTATGRLSTHSPNLQNLPTASDLSKKIRYSVIAPHGFKLVWADYSQIELRVLAHLSEDEKLILAFKEGKDIHTETAVHLFGVSESKVDEKLRRVAKTVNFGIIYGMTPYGLSERLKIPVEEAKEYIERYFKKFPKVKDFIEETLKEAYEKGYVKTLFGRIRPLPELKSSNHNIRSFGERAAVNAKIQGTAADIMKLAMVELYKKLKPLKAHMTLQVHDEIIIETPEEFLEEVVKTTKDTMENVVRLSVPLTATVKFGDHWE